MQNNSGQDDATLIELVARQRDQAAFAELFARYDRAAYSLAMHILDNSKLAEEAVQEAMWRIWASAATFRNEDDSGMPREVRPWLMKIVARESFRMLKQGKKHSKEIHANVERVGDAPGDALAADELLDALRRKLNEVPAEDRQLIALHFGGGLSQREIGQSLSIPQQTVSHRINRVLKDLRSGLAGAGFASATALTAESLGTALSTGHAPAPGLQALVAARVRAARSVRALRSSVSHSSSVTLIVTIAGVASVGTGLWYLSSHRASPPVQPPVAPAAVAEIPAATAPVQPPASAAQPRTGKSFHWTFERDLPSNLATTQGQRRWLPEQKAMLADPEVQIFFQGIQMPIDTVLLTTHAAGVPGSDYISYGATLCRDSKPLVQKANWRRKHLRTSSSMKGECKTYVVGRYLIDYLDQMPMRVIEYDIEDHARAQLLVVARHVRIHDIDFSLVQDEELPPELRDIPALTRDMIRVDLLSLEEREKLGPE